MPEDWSPKEVDRRHRLRTSSEARITSLVELILNDPEKAVERLVTQLCEGTPAAVVAAQLDGAAEVCRRRRLDPNVALEKIRQQLAHSGYTV